MKSRLAIDFSTPEKFQENWETLLRDLFERPLYQKPALGKPPAYITTPQLTSRPAASKFALWRQAANLAADDQRPEPSKSDLQVVFLGTGGPRPAGRAASCNLILTKNRARLLVDAGSGAFARLGEMKMDISDLDTILLTHLHIDHTADVPSFLKARAMTQTQPIEFIVIGPAGAGLYPSTSRFIDLLFGDGGAWAYENSFGAPQKIVSRDLPIDPAAAPAVILQTSDGVRVLSVCTHHGDAPADAYRVEYGGHSVTFSGDIDPAGLDNLTKLAQDSDLLVFNCAVLDPPGSPAELYSRHTPPKRIGEMARAAHVHRLILSHIPPLVDKAQREVTASIRERAATDVEFAEDKMIVPVSP